MPLYRFDPQILATDPSGAGPIGSTAVSIASGNYFYVNPKTENWAQISSGSGGASLSVSGSYLFDGTNYYIGNIPYQTGFPSALTAWYNQSTSTVSTTAPGALQLTFPSDGVVHAYVTGTYPTTPFTRTLAIATGGQSFGSDSQIGLAVTDGTKITVFLAGYQSSVNSIRLINFTNSTTFSSVVTSSSYLLPTIMWMRLNDNGTNLTFSASSDGLNFFQYASVARGSFLGTITGVGICSSSSFGTTLGYTVLSFK